MRATSGLSFGFEKDFLQSVIAGGSIYLMKIGEEAGNVNSEGPGFDLRCPECSGHCLGITYPCGVRGTYRNPYTEYCVKRIVCSRCGIVGDSSKGKSGPLSYELWYRFHVRGNVFYARNREHLQEIHNVLTGRVDRNQSALYALPRWLVAGTNRKRVINVIEKALSGEIPKEHS